MCVAKHMSCVEVRVSVWGENSGTRDEDGMWWTREVRGEGKRARSQSRMARRVKKHDRTLVAI